MTFVNFTPAAATASMLGVRGAVRSSGLKIRSWSLPTSSRMMNRMLGVAGGLGFGAAAATADHPRDPTTRRALNGVMKRVRRKGLFMAVLLVTDKQLDWSREP